MAVRLLAALAVLWSGIAGATPQETAAAGIFDQPATPLAGAPAFAAQAGTPGVIILFQPDCPWCERQFRAALELADVTPEIRIIALGIRGRRMDLVRELRRFRADVPAYLASPALLDLLGRPEGTPRLYVVDDTGRIVSTAAGYQDPEALAALLARLH